MKHKTLTSLGLSAAVLYAIWGGLLICGQFYLLYYGLNSAAEVVVVFIGIVLAVSFITDAIGQYRKILEIRANPSPLRQAEDRLDELERLKRRDMVTPEEYAAKRQEILKDL